MRNRSTATKTKTRKKPSGRTRRVYFGTRKDFVQELADAFYSAGIRFPNSHPDCGNVIVPDNVDGVISAMKNLEISVPKFEC